MISSKSEGLGAITSLLTQLGLENRIVTYDSENYDEKQQLSLTQMSNIDYDAVYEKLNILTEKSKEWLKEALISTMEDKSLINSPESEEKSR